MFKAYNGIEPYAFLSYSHKDIDTLFPLMEKLQQIGCHIWYDEGIHPADEWADTLAKKMTEARFVLLILSHNSIESHNVRREIYYATSKGKDIIPFYLDDVELPDGLALQLGIYQAIKSKHSIIEDAKLLYTVFPDGTVSTQQEAKLLYRCLKWSYYFSIDSQRAFSVIRYDNNTKESTVMFKNEQPEYAEIEASFDCYALRYAYPKDMHPYHDHAVLFQVFCDFVSDRYIARYYVDYHFAIVGPHSDEPSLKILKCFEKNYAAADANTPEAVKEYNEETIPRTWANQV